MIDGVVVGAPAGLVGGFEKHPVVDALILDAVLHAGLTACQPRGDAERPSPLFASVTMLRLALYQPDIPQNTGTLLRMAACLGAAVEIIEPAGFDVSDRHLRRSGLEYLDHVAVTRHRSRDAFWEGSLQTISAP